METSGISGNRQALPADTTTAAEDQKAAEDFENLLIQTVGPMILGRFMMQTNFAKKMLNEALNDK